MWVPVVLLPQQTRLIEGPTKEQAVKMAQRRQGLLQRARQALQDGQDERAFNLDCEAFDLEVDLNRLRVRPRHWGSPP